MSCPKIQRSGKPTSCNPPSPAIIRITQPRAQPNRANRESFRSFRRSSLSGFTTPVIELVIWKRSLPTGFEQWLDSLSGHQLPFGRVLVGEAEMRPAIKAILEASAAPGDEMRTLLLEDVLTLASLFMRTHEQQGRRHSTGSNQSRCLLAVPQGLRGGADADKLSRTRDRVGETRREFGRTYTAEKTTGEKSRAFRRMRSASSKAAAPSLPAGSSIALPRSPARERPACFSASTCLPQPLPIPGYRRDGQPLPEIAVRCAGNAPARRRPVSRARTPIPPLKPSVAH